MTHGTLLADIDRFIADTGMGESYFGRRAVNDGKLIRRLRQGRPVETGTVEKINAFMRAERDRRERMARRVLGQSECAA